MLPSVQCIFIGDSSVGKTALIKNATHQLLPRLPTAGVDMVTYTSKKIRLQCWDTSGQPRFKHILRMFIKSCAAVVYVFDATDDNSFDSILQWHEQLQYLDKIFIVICNKADLPAAKTAKYRLKMSHEWPEIPFIVSSAFMNAVEVMEEVVKLLPHPEQPEVQQIEGCVIV